uniref:Uncharacterized protein n=1 Tax=Fagus sylvatica TaxID=28930 RepID=A0A2N9F5S6_FAGSY
MAVSRRNDPLMCRLFPSSLGEVAMRWFNQLDRRTIDSWDQMAEVFVARFITNSRRAREMDALLTMKLQDNETIKNYSIRFWETYNDIDGCSEEMVINAFKLGLPINSGHMTENCHMLKVLLEKLVSAGHLNQYIDVDLSKKKETSQVVRPPHSSGVPSAGVIHVIHNPLCSTVSLGSYRSRMQKAVHLRKSFSIIDSAHPAPIYTVNRGNMKQVISFSDSDLKDVQLPHNDPLVITLRIGNFDVQRILIDQGSFAEVIYQDLYIKLSLGEAELSNFTSPIYGFSREPIVPLGKTILPVLTGPINLQTEFIVVKAPSPYNAIMGHEEQLLQILIDNRDVFAWSVYDAPSVSPELACHSLNIRSEHRPIVQKRWKLAPERAAIVLEEVERLLASGAIQEVQYPMWLSNMVVVKKKNGKWRLVDSTSGHARLNFLDAFQGYHQIPMNAADQDKTAFITPRGTYYYKTVEAYTDDMLVKSLWEENHVSDLLQVFDILRESRLRLNASKCTFGVSSGKFLGHVVSRRGIEANPDQIAALVDLAEPRNIKQLQRLTVSNHAVSAVFVQELGQEQKPIFFVSKAMDETELRFFWKNHKMGDLSGIPRRGVQASDGNQMTGRWELYVDGASNSKGSGAGIVLVSPDDLILEQAVRLTFSTSNNEAEYEALMIGLKTAEKLGASHLQVFCDSQLVANQISGEYQARDERMEAYLTIARSLLSKFDSVQVAQIEREHNSHADILAKLATALETDKQRTVCIETLDQPSFQNQEVSVCSINCQSSWMDPILSYLKDNKLPEDRKEAKMIKRKAPRYWVSDEGLLYRRSFTGLYLLCVHPEKVRDFLFKIHEGICGSHTGGRSLAHRAISQGYWWPYMQADALKYVHECDKCQRFAPMIHQPARELNLLSSPWPFAQWGLDIVGPFPRAPGNKRFFIVTTDYFTKWVEAEPLSNIRDVDTKRFLWKNVITRFGIPWAAISDNGTQFESKLFKRFCSELGIRNFFSSPGYPQSNGQAEVSNKIILSGIKRKLEAAKGKWVEELPSVLWTHRTIVRKSTGETPFALAFGVEAIIPLEIGMPTTRTTEFAVETNEENLRKDLDLLEERRNLAMVHLASYQQRIKREHNKSIKPREFRVGELVLRKVMANTRRPNKGKLGPN